MEQVPGREREVVEIGVVGCRGRGVGQDLTVVVVDHATETGEPLVALPSLNDLDDRFFGFAEGDDVDQAGGQKPLGQSPGIHASGNDQSVGLSLSGQSRDLQGHLGLGREVGADGDNIELFMREVLADPLRRHADPDQAVWLGHTIVEGVREIVLWCAD